MKIRSDFVTNSSSSSFIVCFARIADKEKAKTVLENNYNIEVFTSQEALAEIEGSGWSKWLEYDWAGVDATPTKEYITKYIDDDFIVITDSFDIDESGGYPDYDVDYDDFDTKSIDEITENNGFADIDIQYGAGRNG